MKKKLLKIQFIALLFLFIGKTTFAQWQQVNPAGSFDRSRGSTFIIGDTAYLGNGDNNATTWTNTFYGYTQSGNTWVSEPTFPASGGDLGFYFTIGDTGYIGDGAGPGYEDALYAYTPSSGWSAPLATPPGGAMNFNAGFSINHKGYFGTGDNNFGNSNYNGFYEYEPNSNTWITLTPYPHIAWGGVGFSANSKGYIGLGYNGNATFNDMYQYDTLTQVWDTMASLPPFGEAEPAYFVLCGKLIVVSGQITHSTTNATDQTWMFDPADGPKGTWTRLPNFPGDAAYSPTGFAMGDTGFVFGGKYGGTNVSQMWRYVPTLSLSLALAADTVVCPGTQVALNAAGGATYAWSTNTGSLGDTTGTVDYDTTSSIIVSPLATTTYYYTATGNPCFNLDSLVIKVNPGTLTVEPPSPKICNGESVTLTVTDTSGSFTWAPSGELSDTTGDTVVATPTITTVYTVTGNANSGCVSTGTDTVSVITAPPLVIQPQLPSICPGTNVALSVPISGTGYAWSPVSTLSSSTGDTVIASPLTQTTYEVTGTDSLGCVVSDSDVVYVSNAPNKPTITTYENDLISSATQGNQWLRNDTVITGATNQTYIVTKGGYYQVIASNPANGCSTESDSSFATGINQLTVESGQVTVYPNPTGGEIFVNISSSARDMKDWNLEITDVLGRTVYGELSLNYNNTVDLSNLSSGVYFICVVNKTGRVVVPVVKQ